VIDRKVEFVKENGFEFFCNINTISLRNVSQVLMTHNYVLMTAITEPSSLSLQSQMERYDTGSCSLLLVNNNFMNIIDGVCHTNPKLRAVSIELPIRFMKIIRTAIT